MNKMIITGITILQGTDTILLHGMRTNGDLPLGLTIEADIKEQFILFIFFVVNKYSQDYRHKSVSV